MVQSRERGKKKDQTGVRRRDKRNVARKTMEATAGNPETLNRLAALGIIKKNIVGGKECQ